MLERGWPMDTSGLLEKQLTSYAGHRETAEKRNAPQLGRASRIDEALGL